VTPRREPVDAPPQAAAGDAIRRLDGRPSQLAYWLLKRTTLPLARAHRRRLRSTRFVAVTGTAGKSTTVDLAAAVLAAAGPGTATRRNSNRAKGLLKTLLATRRRHRFSVHELAAWGPGTLDELLWTLEPDAGIVTAVGREHHKTFRSVAAVAREKAKLVHGLPASGLALLNADDPRVRAMADGCRARTVLFGRAADSDVRAEEVAAAWPEPLRFVAVRGGLRLPVQTRLFGLHWLAAALAAVALGLELGIEPAAVAAAVAGVDPQPGRLTAHPVTGGVTFLDDGWKAPTWSLPHAVDVLRAARCGRRILVLGQLSDDPRGPRRLFRDLVAELLPAVDHLVMVGRWARYGDLPVPAAGERPEGLHLCATVRHADRLLADLLRPGDLVLLKGSRSVDHLERLILARDGGVGCWRESCGRLPECTRCRLRGRPEAAG
jgi:UDP-N-acetylmuramoyl-tripeptide--D-alanyl-D-alanine ligase